MAPSHSDAQWRDQILANIALLGNDETAKIQLLRQLYEIPKHDSKRVLAKVTLLLFPSLGTELKARRFLRLKNNTPWTF